MFINVSGAKKDEKHKQEMAEMCQEIEALKREKEEEARKTIKAEAEKSRQKTEQKVKAIAYCLIHTTTLSE